jgi:aldehyde dehydrogenase (NAD+)
MAFPFQAGRFLFPSASPQRIKKLACERVSRPSPVLCVITYEDEADAIRIANDALFGLHAYVSGADLNRTRQVASQIRAGRVAIKGIQDDQQAPFGGFKYSGVGRELGIYGIESYLEARAILE